MSVCITSQMITPAAGALGNKRTDGLFTRLLGSVVTKWRRHRMIAAFEAMDDRLLDDIGITRGDIRDVVNSFDTRELQMVPVAPATRLVSANHMAYQAAA
ncbi:DUF1127 domain-containing protein [Pseudorhodobacter sp.]|uniref:DUF1127 domain-containing protein n=1 Tax=Pseudorhodobacter sp. TaxID=1934400 RepID=UPI0039E540F9